MMPDAKSTMVRAACLLLVVLLLLPTFAACERPIVIGNYSGNFADCFDTTLSITIPAHTREEADVHIIAIHDRLLTLHRLFDAHKAYEGVTNIHTLNQSAGQGPVRVDPHIIALLMLGKHFAEERSSKINILIGSTVAMWKDASKTGKIPGEKTIAASLELASPHDLTIDEANNTVTLAREGNLIDVGAVAKGYAMEIIRTYAKEAGVTSLLVNLGGHVMTVGTRPDNTPWELSIVNPITGKPFGNIQISDASVVTSGDYERGLSINDHMISHIFDPDTGLPASLHASVTVIIPADATADADAWSTALYLLPIEEGKALLQSHVPGAGAIWVEKSGKVTSFHIQMAPVSEQDAVW